MNEFSMNCSNKIFNQVSATYYVVFQVLLLSTLSTFQALLKITRLFCSTLPGDKNKNQRQIIVGIMRSWALSSGQCPLF